MENPKNWRRNLPHVRVEHGIYFVTWRLHAKQPHLHDLARTEVVSALRFFDQKRFRLFALVVMNDHVHVVVEPTPPNTLEAIIHSWKSFSAHRLQRAHGRVGAVWQAEYYDRFIRGNSDLLEKIGYIMDNPKRRWPEMVSPYEWSWCVDM